jgi:hypothetical protein
MYLIDYLCIHTPRKEYRHLYPIKINLIRAVSRKEALKEFSPFHPNEPFIKHYNKPYAVSTIETHYIG